MNMNIYDRKGRPMDVEQFSVKHADMSYRVVASAKFMEGKTEVHISTVWLGINHNHSGEGDPVIFETMVFGGKFSEFQCRYSTLIGAIKGHKMVLESVQKGERPPLQDTNIFKRFFTMIEEQRMEEEAGEEWKKGTEYDKDSDDE